MRMRSPYSVVHSSTGTSTALIPTSSKPALIRCTNSLCWTRKYRFETDPTGMVRRSLFEVLVTRLRSCKQGLERQIGEVSCRHPHPFKAFKEFLLSCFHVIPFTGRYLTKLAFRLRKHAESVYKRSTCYRRKCLPKLTRCHDYSAAEYIKIIYVLADFYAAG